MNSFDPGEGREFEPGPGDTVQRRQAYKKEREMIRKLQSGYRIYSRKIDPKTGKRRNLGTFTTLAGAKKHEREIQYFKRAAG
jgi:hypothetical protein